MSSSGTILLAHCRRTSFLFLLCYQPLLPQSFSKLSPPPCAVPGSRKVGPNGKLGLHRTNPAKFCGKQGFSGPSSPGTCTGHTQNGRLWGVPRHPRPPNGASQAVAHTVYFAGASTSDCQGPSVGCTQTSHKSGTCTGLLRVVHVAGVDP